MMRRCSIVFSLTLLLLGCSGGSDSAIGGVSQSEADALNNAAALLDQPAVTGSVTTAAPPQKEIQ